MQSLLDNGSVLQSVSMHRKIIALIRLVCKERTKWYSTTRMLFFDTYSLKCVIVPILLTQVCCCDYRQQQSVLPILCKCIFKSTM